MVTIGDRISGSNNSSGGWVRMSGEGVISNSSFIAFIRSIHELGKHIRMEIRRRSSCSDSGSGGRSRSSGVVIVILFVSCCSEAI